MGNVKRRDRQGAKVLGLGMAALFLVAAAYAAAPSRLLWVVKAGEDVDKTHAESIYFKACQWIEEQMELEDGPVRPKLTVHVGEACPRAYIEGACMNPVLGELYLPKWDEESPNAVAQATVATALYHLLNEETKRASGMQMAGNTAGSQRSPYHSAAVR